jgi:ribosome-binding factor A
MASLRNRKVADLIKKEISQIINTLYPSSRYGFITVTHIRVTDDLGLAYIYFSYLGTQHSVQDIQDLLSESIPEVRHKLSKAVRMRRHPQLKFFKDDSLEYANQIDGMIEKIHIKDNKKDNE